jgi:hypothetical protein
MAHSGTRIVLRLTGDFCGGLPGLACQGCAVAIALSPIDYSRRPQEGSAGSFVAGIEAAKTRRAITDLELVDKNPFGETQYGPRKGPRDGNWVGSAKNRLGQGYVLASRLPEGVPAA